LVSQSGLKSWIKRHSHLYRLIAASWHRIMPVQESFDQLEAKLFDPACWQAGDLTQAIVIYQQEFARMAEICALKKIDLCVCIIPTAHAVRAAEVGGNSSQVLGRALDTELPARKVHLLFEKLGIAYVDTTSSLADLGSKKTYFQYDGHLTPLGHRVVADVIRTKVLGRTASTTMPKKAQERFLWTHSALIHPLYRWDTTVRVGRWRRSRTES
jgi:hypothetical protein